MPAFLMTCIATAQHRVMSNTSKHLTSVDDTAKGLMLIAA